LLIALKTDEEKLESEIQNHIWAISAI
jgi:hypothetical protein